MAVLERVTSMCALTGGTAWIAAAVYRSTMPRGCIDEECASRPMRGETPLGTTLWLVAVCLMVAAGVGLLISLQRRDELSRSGVLGVASCVAGVALLGTGLLTARLFPGFAEGAMPAFVIPGLVLVAAGLVAAAVVILRSRMLPRWAGTALLIGAVLLLFSNEQNARVLLAVPLGIAWILLGAAVWRLRVGGAAGVGEGAAART